MNDSPDVAVDVLILGGGIAGLWLLDRLRHAGFSAALLEADRLGAGQSVASQGIIHGGTKYTFGRVFDSAVRELRQMPAIWREGLEGESGPDLTAARTLSSHTCMWVPRQLGGGVLGAVSRTIMRSRVEPLPRAEWPDALDSKAADGSVYALDEVVLDVPSVLEALHAGHRDCIRRIPDPADISFAEGGGSLRVGGLTIAAQRIVLAAGAGNEDLIERAGIAEVRQQRRPLHQVVVKGMKQPLYAHCVGKSTKPLATVTAHPSSAGDYVWNVGGLIAEDGVAQSAEALVERARRELPQLLPGADFGSARWATFRIDRAEWAGADGRLPGGPVLQPSGAYIVAWPTKLALAPALAERIAGLLEEQQLRPAQSRTEALASLPEPEVARPPWERIESWS